MEVRNNRGTDKRKISPFYRTSSPIGAAAQKGSLPDADGYTICLASIRCHKADKSGIFLDAYSSSHHEKIAHWHKADKDEISQDSDRFTIHLPSETLAQSIQK